MAFVTLKGIREAVSNIAPRPGTLQDQFLSLLLSYFNTEESLSEITSISPDEFIAALWEVDSSKEIKKKKKNFSSLKSAINKRLKELAGDSKNPEGLIIGKDNVFTISEEHKNNLLQKLGISSGQSPAMNFLASVRGMIEDLAAGGDSTHLQNILAELEKTREVIDQHLKGEGGTEDTDDTSGEEQKGSGTPEDIEEIELGEGEEIVVVADQGSPGDQETFGTGETDPVGTVLFLASAASDMISGQIIYVDGGTVMI